MLLGNQPERFHAKCYRIVDVNPERKHLIHSLDLRFALKPMLVQPYVAINGIPSFSIGVCCDSIRIVRNSGPLLVDACAMGDLHNATSQMCIWRDILALDEPSQFELRQPLQIKDRVFPKVSDQPVFLAILDL